MKSVKYFLMPSFFAFALVLLLPLCMFLSGCYTLTQGVTMLGYLNRAVPLEQIAADDPQNAEFVQLVNDIRTFAMEELGLAMSRNYTRYVSLDRDYLAAVVSASAKDSFRQHEWNYPVVGRMPYKGFFNVEGARRERNRLERRGLDVWIRGVDAFSTLGWFRDPLFSYMKNYPPERLADLIIHELVHATVFIKGQMQFNEELAEFIGSRGARLFMERRFGIDSEEYQRMLATEADSKTFVAFIHELIAELETLYSSGGETVQILAEKERIIKNAQEHFEAEYDNRFLSGNYRGFSTLPVNNAYLALFRLYYAEDNFYEDLFERAGSDLPAFIAAAKTVTRRGGDPRAQLERAVMN